MFIVFENDV